MDQLDEEGKLGKNKQFREYIDNMQFKIPEDFPTAKYVIVLAREEKLALVNVHYKDKKQEIMVSPSYYEIGIKSEDMINLIRNEIIKNNNYRIERARGLHLKLLAVRSGLTKYGRNNISYDDEFGSFLLLSAYYTDFDFQKEELYEKKMMDKCQNCKICIKACPTGCISEDNFVINVDRCIPLYNELEGEFPDWLDSKSHNALIGCMKCQMFCPVNSEAMKHPIKFEDLTEEETLVLLNADKNSSLLESISVKLHMPIATNTDDYLPALKRNLAILLQ